MTTTYHDADTLVPAYEALSRSVNAQWAQWRAARPPVVDACGLPQTGPHPAPDDPDGLPEGWHIMAAPMTLVETILDMWLIRREQGGWVIVQHNSYVENSTLRWMDVTLSAMYAHVEECIADNQGPPEELRQIRDWLHGVLSNLFDLTDPNEAGMRTMFLLGAPLVVPPRAAL